MFIDEWQDEYIPVRAAGYTQAECNGRNMYVINGRKYSECSFCGASCPSRDYFKEPDSGLPLKCDMCENEPPLTEPMCVQVCEPGALTYIEREEEGGEKEEKRDEMEMGLEALVNKYGLKKVTDTIARISTG